MDEPIPLYRPGTELHIVTAGGLNFRGQCLNQRGDYVTIRDRRTERDITFCLLHIQFVEVIGR